MVEVAIEEGLKVQFTHEGESMIGVLSNVPDDADEKVSILAENGRTYKRMEDDFTVITEDAPDEEEVEVPTVTEKREDQLLLTDGIRLLSVSFDLARNRLTVRGHTSDGKPIAIDRKVPAGSEIAADLTLVYDEKVPAEG